MGQLDQLRLDYRVILESGEEKWISDCSVPVRDPETGEVVGSLGIIQDVTWRKRAERELLDQSRRDPLTGLPNRRSFEERLHTEWRRGMRTGRYLTVGLVDVDHFKQFNDRHGHRAGDACLVEVGRCLKDCFTRAGEFVARWGGEEFTIILPELNAEEAEVSVERFRARVATQDLVWEGQSLGPITVSAGIATAVPGEDISLESLFEAADRALFASKQAGRNRVTRAEPGTH